MYTEPYRQSRTIHPYTHKSTTFCIIIIIISMLLSLLCCVAGFLVVVVFIFFFLYNILYYVFRFRAEAQTALGRAHTYLFSFANI